MSDFLSLKKYFIEELNIQAPMALIPEKKLNIEMTTDLAFGKNQAANNIYLVSLTCAVQYKELPDYKIKAKITGIFGTGEKCTNEEMRDRLLSNGAASTLYGILREVLRASNSQTTYPLLILPIIHFEEQKITFADEE